VEAHGGVALPHRRRVRQRVVVSLLLALGAFVSRTARGVIHDVVAILNATLRLRVDRDLDHLVRPVRLGADLHHFHDHAAVVASNLVEGVESVDRRLLEMGDVYRRRTAVRSFVSIVVPSTLPYLIAGMKIGFGLALKARWSRDLRGHDGHLLGSFAGISATS